MTLIKLIKTGRYHVFYNIKDVDRRQKLTTDFFRLLEMAILVVNISISRKKYAYRGFQRVIF